MPEQTTWYLHKYEVSQQYAGPEEGGRWYNLETPVEDWEPIEIHAPVDDSSFDHKAYVICRRWNHAEKTRRGGLQYGYTSVLSHMEEFYTYDVTTNPNPNQPQGRPHYE